MDCISFNNLFYFVVICWLSGAATLYVQNKIFHKISLSLIVFGVAALIFFLIHVWLKIERPPMRTLGETRLWYALFLTIIGLITYRRWRYKWFVVFVLCMALLFLGINYFSPEVFDKTLMPALLSPYFIPHVIAYIIAYAFLATSSLVAIKGLFQLYYAVFEKETLNLAGNLVYLGFTMLTFGLLFGALWAKEAWGHYWTWDPKETWAFLTWLSYLLYIHYRFHRPVKWVSHLWILSLAFIILLICWFGINYLPSAANSVHTYSG